MDTFRVLHLIMHWIVYFLFSTCNAVATPTPQNFNDLNTYQLRDASNNVVAATDAFDAEIAEYPPDSAVNDVSTQTENIIDGHGDFDNILTENDSQTQTIIRRNSAVCKADSHKKYVIPSFTEGESLPVRVPVIKDPIKKTDRHRCPEEFPLLLSCGGYAVFFLTLGWHDIYDSVTNCVNGTY